MTATHAHATWRRRLPVAMLAFAAVASMCGYAAELPPEIQADRYLVQAQREIQAGEHAAGVATLDKILALKDEHGLAIPPVFWFKQAQACRDAGRFEQAVNSATQYLIEAGREGEHYLAALELLDAAEQELEAQRKREAELRARREREQAERLAVARYRAARERLEAAGGRMEGSFADPLNSGGYGPEMVVIPAGSFRMGCLADDDDCNGDEQPVREVRIAQPFALSAHEVTFAEWGACLAAGSCGGHEPGDSGWGRGVRPVIEVSWHDAQKYVAWLSAQTGAEYRLPSESEWEYAARAGSATKYSWGEEIGTNRANCNSDRCGDGFFYTAPVGSFRPNAFGLYDMHGNVLEWVRDCWNGSYAGAPSDGGAWTSGNCERRVLRGGSWYGNPREIRAASRLQGIAGFRGYIGGFRVARTLTP